MDQFDPHTCGSSRQSVGRTRRAPGYLVLVALSVLAANCATTPSPNSRDADVRRPPPPLQLVYDEPAEDWERNGLPIGNGAMGAMVIGGLAEDRIQFNEKTLWTGGPGSEGYDFGLPPTSIADEVKAVASDIFTNGSMEPEEAAERLGREMTAYGHYQSFGEIVVSGLPARDASDYRRTLDLNEGEATVTYDMDGTQYTRRYLASYPDQVIAIRYEADAPAAVSLSVDLDVPDNRSATYHIAHNRLTVRGALHDNGLRYETQLAVLTDGGVVASTDETLMVANADAVTILLTAGTDYALAHPHYRGDDPHDALTEILDAAVDRGWADIHARHATDYSTLFDRLALDIGQEPAPHFTDDLLAQYDTLPPKHARYLEALYFQYGRYLLIGSSRDGSLPANLQGVWNNSDTPPWNADYHININLQMNYWPADPLNLGELNAPLFDFVDNLAVSGQDSARLIMDAPGWSAYLNTTPWGYSGLIAWPTAFWQPEAAAWLAQHYYEHARFTNDETFLRERAYPIMKGASEFWLHALQPDPRDDLLVVAPSYSPEHGPFTAGAAMSQQIVFDLFTNTHEAGLSLGDTAFAETLEEKLGRLDTGLRIGSWGQLQEWKEDRDDPENSHRHMSHAFALHPGRQIHAAEDAELTEAFRVSLNARGEGRTGWSKAWKMNIWARLLDGDQAHRLFGELLRHSTLPNLLDDHPPFQIDGNFGGAAGVGEMLLQSQHDELHILPALPSAWPSGQVYGLRARGDVGVDIVWANGHATTVTLHPGASGPLRIRSDLLERGGELRDAEGKTVDAAVHNGVAEFTVKAGQRYTLSLEK